MFASIFLFVDGIVEVYYLSFMSVPRKKEEGVIAVCLFIREVEATVKRFTSLLVSEGQKSQKFSNRFFKF